MADAQQIIITSLVISIVLLLGVPIVESISTQRETVGGERVLYDEAILADAGTFVSIDDTAGMNETVYKTTGFAINFTGANDSNLSGTGALSFGNETDWHVSVWGRPDAGTEGDTMQVTAISDGELIIYYNGSASEWRAWYYKQSTRDSYEVAIAAPSPVSGNFTNIQVRANDTHLTIFRNTTAGGTADITTSSTVDAPTEAGNWDGRVEELRTFDTAQNSSVIGDLHAQPVQQRPGLNRSARLMFDQPQRPSETLILLTGQTATASNVTFASGFPEQIMDEQTVANDLAGTSDYRWKNDGPQLAPVADGEIDGAPAAYASYERPATGIALTDFIVWYSVAALLPLVLIATFIIGRLR